MDRIRDFGWLRPFAQPVTYLGIVMLACIYAATFYLRHQDSEFAVAEATRQGENLARMFGESVSRAFKSADITILALRRSYQKSPSATDLTAWATDPDLRNDLTFQFSISDANGIVIASSYGPGAIGIDISDRAHFRAHVDSSEDKLFISDPGILRGNGKPAVFLSRRLSKPDGSFDGVLSVSVDLQQFERYYRALELGDEGIVTLINRDGVIVARGANGQTYWEQVGQRFPFSGALKALAGADRASYWNLSKGGVVDGVRRLISCHVVEGFPLVAIVGTSEAVVFRHADKNARIYWSIVGVFTSAIMIAIGFGAARERKLLIAASAIAHQAHHDALTDLPNRVLFGKHIDRAISLMRRRGDPFNLLLFDLDHFKAINDTLGHAVGDLLVKAVAQRLSNCLRATDIVGRIGGDEFAVLQFVEGEQRDAAAILARRLLRTIGEPFNLDGHQVIVETSIGIALAPADGEAAEQLLKHADLALYRAKADGRNTFRCFEAPMGSEARRRYDLEVDLRASVARSEFEIDYQRLVDARNREVLGVEALMRWRHPQRGDVPPDTFVPIAESTGLIVPLGEWILRQACLDAAGWPPHLKVAVNLSPIQFRKGDIVGTVTDALAEAGLPPERLELEITESVLLQKDELNISKLYQLKALGVSIVLDDFGIGYSSLSYLRTFPFDKIKIDRSFVAEVSTRPDCAAIVCAITGLAKSLNMATTAEGVETVEQLELLFAAGCDQVQGYLFGRPCPAAKLRFDRIEAAGDGEAAA